ncbi:Venom serine carboxypeptidase [Orchesella cincta]|uniref:Venom serine carboxypeptidase n=1 Tax=Orchesella cincta TaxID=48709 RepID=A0A1D2MLR8_ORCCI|nr:Venom serine carboxypeptidase [Orchesella cincta]
MDVSLFSIAGVVLQFATVFAQDVDPGEPLFLSPLIKAGELSEALGAAFVSEFFPLLSYSGYITVNEEYNSNIFFWFFPAMPSDGSGGIGDLLNDKPVILWHSPGISGFFSVFGENGPFIAAAGGTNYSLNPFSWSSEYNMIFMDSPVEVGYSFTENEAGFVTAPEEAARDIYSFITQLLSMFPNFRRNAFYTAGASYGATYAISTADYIRTQNQGVPEIYVNLTGVILESPFIDAQTQAKYADPLFSAGLVNSEGAELIRSKENQLKNLVNQGNYSEAFNTWLQVTQVDIQNLTGYGAQFNLYQGELPIVDMTNYVTLNSTRKALKVGSRNFSYVSRVDQSQVQANMMKSMTPKLDTLLNEGFRMLMYVGNMDITTGHLGVAEVLKSLSWEGKTELINGSRTIWKVNDSVAGYITSATNATFAIVRNAGHGVLGNQPDIAGVLLLQATVFAQDVDPGEPLFLSPLIKAGELSKAQEAALVFEFLPLISYSGYITVNEEYNSNIFFWFFPAVPSDGSGGIGDLLNDKPVILWHDGGPGITGFFSIFGQNGPFIGTAGGTNYTSNPFSWSSEYNMIFMDNPVEVGYSFTENEAGYVTGPEEAARDIYSFITQLLSMFPNFRRNAFYTAGASYGATYAISTADYIRTQNQGVPEIYVNLTGVILDSPFIDVKTQAKYADPLFSAGLVNSEGAEFIRSKENQLKDLINQENYLEAFSAWTQVTQIDIRNLTGFGALYNIYLDELPFVDMTSFVTLNSTRKALKVGSRNFSFVNPAQQSRMHANMMKSMIQKLDTLLNEGFRMLMYVGNMDITTGHLGVAEVIKLLSWEGKTELINGTRTIWKVNNRVAGYITSSTNATFAIVRNAGHGVPGDQPEWVLDVVGKFLNVTKSAS